MESMLTSNAPVGSQYSMTRHSGSERIVPHSISNSSRCRTKCFGHCGYRVHRYVNCPALDASMAEESYSPYVEKCPSGICMSSLRHFFWKSVFSDESIIASSSSLSSSLASPSSSSWVRSMWSSIVRSIFVFFTDGGAFSSSWTSANSLRFFEGVSCALTLLLLPRRAKLFSSSSPRLTSPSNI
jgi:hypothetical protein